ncbi:srpk [Metarhizium guizhouense ARSEF 977]|uniref:Srpk n=1 Tax=Metarhizium guizhouense (strain ARSEF 977) TaxID=1276136 RepID=A0A0B4GT52_METGA|nr:srpk [Metarhizium guizhouense ARSEF 977]
MPKQLIGSTGWDEWVDEDEEDIRLIDWGQTFRCGKEPAHLAQPGDLKAPEIIFTGRFDHRVDLWRAGGIIYTLVFAARPFFYLGDEAELIAQMIGFVEDLPLQWRQEWEASNPNEVMVLIP